MALKLRIIMVETDKICARKGCERKRHAKVFCLAHYNSYLRRKNRNKLRSQYGFTVYGNRISLLSLLGAQCIKCGFRDIRALQLDHIEGHGCQERKQKKGNQRMIDYYLKHPIEAIKKLQVLCANCNTIKLTEERDVMMADHYFSMELKPRTQT